MTLQVDFRDPKIQKMAFAVIMFLGVNYLFFFTDYVPFFYQPKKAVVEEKRQKYERLDTLVEEAKRASANLPALEAELADLHDRWEVAMSHLPEKKEIASLLRRVTLAGERSGVRFTLFEPEEVFGHGVYDEHPVSVKVEGGFHGIGSFFAKLMNLERIVQVSHINLRTQRTENDEQTVLGEMNISAYTIPLQAAATGSSRPAQTNRTDRRDAHTQSDEDHSEE